MSFIICTENNIEYLPFHDLEDVLALNIDYNNKLDENAHLLSRYFGAKCQNRD